MNSSSKLYSLTARSLAAGWAFAIGLATAAPIASAAPPKKSAEPATLHTLTLANGDELSASIIAYSLHSRVITLQLINGRTAYVAPRDLTAMSKLTWLTSPAFIENLQNYRPSEKAIASVVERMIGPLAGVFLGGLLSFWLAITFVGGQKRFYRAAKTYSKSVFQALLIALALSAAHYGVAKGLGDSPVAPMIHSALLMVALFAVVTVVSNQIGVDYDFSGWMGFGVMMAGAGIALVLATSTLYLLPRYLEQPGLDDWFTDQLLVPLGLA
jgi:hypothetical protein